jgi:acetyl esterase/lipase
MASSEYIAFRKTLPEALAKLDAPLPDRRLQFAKWLSSFPAPTDLRIEQIDIKDLPATWVIAPEANRKRILLFFFGGGFGAGTVASNINFMGRLSLASNAAVLGIDYRLAPEHPFPAALEDALQAYRWLLHHPYSRSRIVLCGISAGANIALSLLLKLKIEQIGLPGGALLFSPWLDLSITQSAQKNDMFKGEHLAETAKLYANGQDLKNPLISPLFGDLEGLPPLFIQTSKIEVLYPQAVELDAKAKKAHVQCHLDAWDDLIHAWQLFAPQFPEANQAIERIGPFLDGAVFH